MVKKGKQIFLKIVRVTSKLTSQRTLQINNAHLDSIHCWHHLQETTKNFLIHSELTKANKSQRFFTEGAVIYTKDKNYLQHIHVYSQYSTGNQFLVQVTSCNLGTQEPFGGFMLFVIRQSYLLSLTYYLLL